MKINHIKALSNGMYELNIDGKKYRYFSDVLLKYNLLKPQEISDDLFRKLNDTNEFYEGMKISIKYITSKLRTEKEIKDKLYKNNISKSNISLIINKLKEDNYLNNDNYIKAYINDAVKLTLKGPNKIFNELKIMGFNSDLIQNCLNMINNSYWEEKVLKIIKKRQKTGNVSKKRLILKLKEDLIALGFNEEYFKYLDNIDYNEEKAYEKDYQKIKKSLLKKYDEDKIDFYLKQKLYALGYNLDNKKKID